MADFDFFQLSNQLCCLSSDGRKFATAVLDKVVIKDVESMQLVRIFSCLDAVQYLEWSPDSTMILCGMPKRSLLQIWMVDTPEWTCKIDEGSAGVVDMRWSPDSRHVLTTSDFHLRLTVWSLVSKNISYIKYPKPCSKYLDFTNDGRYLAVAERRDCRDHVSFFCCSNWSRVAHFAPETENLDGVSWSPVWDVLCVWESCLSYKVLIYSLHGQCLATYSAYDLALGIKFITWSPSGQFLAIGSYDEKLRLLNHLTWRVIEEFPHSEIPTSDVVIYREVVTDNSKNYLQQNSSSYYEVIIPTGPDFYVPSTRSSPNSAGLKVGVGLISFSSDSSYVATRNDSMPTCVWIWSMRSLKCCALLVQNDPIKAVAWDPLRPRLALCTGSCVVFVWTPEGALSVTVPCGDESFPVLGLKWLPTDGSRLALISRDCMCWCDMHVNEPSR